MDEDLMRTAGRARDELRAAEDTLVAKRQAYEESVRRLHGTGLSAEQLTEALGESSVSINRILGARGTDLLRCSFCGRSQKEVQSLIAGPGTYICGSCVELAGTMLDAGGQSGPGGGTMIPVPLSGEMVCSFCGKSRAAVEHLLAGSDDNAICDECLDLCNEITQEERS